MNQPLERSLRRVLAHPRFEPVARSLRQRTFRGTAAYWEHRYASGGTSGAGSAGPQAVWKAEVINRWVQERAVSSVVDFGCGDGQQLALATYPRYLGVDPSATAVRMCMARFAEDETKSFLCLRHGDFADPAGWLVADLALSVEVLFHLVEDDVYDAYLRTLFHSASRYVVICSNDTEGTHHAAHERHRSFTAWVAQNLPRWSLEERIDPPDGVDLMSSMYLYSTQS